MHRTSLVIACLCLLTSGPLVVAADANVTMPQNPNSTENATNMSVTAFPATVSPSASSPTDSSSSTSSPSMISPSSSSSTMSPSTIASSSSSTMSPSTIASSSSFTMSPSTIASSSSSTMSPSTIASSSSPPMSPSTISSSSSASQSVPSSSPVSAGISFSSSVSSFSSASSINIVSSNNIQGQSTATAFVTAMPREMSDPTYLPMIAAIISGFGCLLLLFILFVSMALVYRHLGKEDSTMMLKKPKKGADAFYDGLEPQSAQYLVSSTSITSFGSSPSDARLESHLPNSPGVHYNRGYDVDHNPSGAGGVSNGHEDGYKPIQIVAADVNPRASSTIV